MDQLSTQFSSRIMQDYKVLFAHMSEILWNDFLGVLLWLSHAKAFVEFQEFSWVLIFLPYLDNATVLTQRLLFPVLTFTLFWWCISTNDYASIEHAWFAVFSKFLSVYNFYLLILKNWEYGFELALVTWVQIFKKTLFPAPMKRKYVAIIWLSVNTWRYLQ